MIVKNNHIYELEQQKKFIYQDEFFFLLLVYMLTFLKDIDEDLNHYDEPVNKEWKYCIILNKCQHVFN